MDNKELHKDEQGHSPFTRPAKKFARLARVPRYDMTRYLKYFLNKTSAKILNTGKGIQSKIFKTGYG